MKKYNNITKIIKEAVCRFSLILSDQKLESEKMSLKFKMIVAFLSVSCDLKTRDDKKQIQERDLVIG